MTGDMSATTVCESVCAYGREHSAISFQSDPFLGVSKAKRARVRGFCQTRSLANVNGRGGHKWHNVTAGGMGRSVRRFQSLPLTCAHTDATNDDV